LKKGKKKKKKRKRKKKERKKKGKKEKKTKKLQNSGQNHGYLQWICEKIMLCLCAALPCCFGDWG